MTTARNNSGSTIKGTCFTTEAILHYDNTVKNMHGPASRNITKIENSENV